MGTARAPQPAKYFVALLSSDAELLSIVERDLSSGLSPIDRRSEVLPWRVSDFYAREMGRPLVRRFFSFSALLAPEFLAAMKLRTQRLEEVYRVAGSGGRRINLDPGYLDAYKVVLASTKNANQRIYLREGIYAEATLFYHHAAFHGLHYTYADYLWPETLAFFSELRALYLSQLRQPA